MKVKIAELRNIVHKAILRYGYTENEAKIIEEILLYAQLRGNNQGIVKLIGKGIPKNPEATEPKVIKETKLSALIDGGKNMGMIAMKKALDMAITKAREHGFGIVGNNNTYSSTGALGYYASNIAKQGLIGFVFAGSPPTVSPYNSNEAVYGTNPLAIGVPADPEPIVIDMATATMAYYGLIEAKTAGRKIPPDIAYDSAGNLTDDPGLAMDGAIKGFGGYKGSGLGFIVTAFTGPLLGAAFAGVGERGDWGNLVIAIDPELLIDRETFKKNVTLLGQKVKQARKLPGVEEIYLPSERGNKLTKSHLESGEIEIEDNLYLELVKVGENKL